MNTKKIDFKDLNNLFQIEKICFPDSFWLPEQIKSHFLTNSGLGFFLQKDHLSKELNLEILAGYLLYSENDFEMEILRLGVIPERRKSGIAENLLDELKKINKEIFLEVSMLNLPAIQLYKKSEFQAIGKRKNYYKNGEDALILKYIPLKEKL